MSSTRGQAVVTIVENAVLPAGMAGAGPLSIDVRCYLIPGRDGLILIDTGLHPDARPIAEALTALGADWADISDIVVTHNHPDHVGGLPHVTSRAPNATCWSGDRLAGSATPAEDGSSIHGLLVIATPGHTPGHRCLLDEDQGLLFTGDAIGAQAGRMTQGPAAFIADPEHANRSLRLLAGTGAQRMLFGHGPELDNPASALTELITTA